jgi:hypothetical protein
VLGLEDPLEGDLDLERSLLDLVGRRLGGRSRRLLGSFRRLLGFRLIRSDGRLGRGGEAVASD